MDGVYQFGIFKKLRNLLNNKSISIINTLQCVGTVTSAPSQPHQKRVFLFFLLCRKRLSGREILWLAKAAVPCSAPR